ncbi:hypothetical protein [Chondromyces crocatus]|uniref:DUF697 domain-containing protein n=1 Tax=Chondromyces crocatus TaxID=52 RepID=A0A0K1ELU6_CHOCO|nr:hypothetical protein [Chondromyces crocatus]AKT41801.1 uncharacterized protein CMC5_060120 [Chondromyces crocatus]
MTTCKEESRRWVHRYAIGGAAFAAIPLTGTTAGLATLETHMMSVIGSIYGETVGVVSTTALGGSFTILGQGLRFFTRRVGTFLPAPAGLAVRLAVAGVTVEVLGFAIVEHFERKFPGKVFQKTDL